MLNKEITVNNIIIAFEKQDCNIEIEVIAGNDFLNNKIVNSDVFRPSLCLTGFSQCFQGDSIQLLGQCEVQYLKLLEENNEISKLDHFFSNSSFPCIIFSHENEAIPNYFIEKCLEKKVPLLKTNLSINKSELKISECLERLTAPKSTMHGVFVEVFGIGILILGASGIGKSECALELIERGHRLIADDVVMLIKMNSDEIEGSGVSRFPYFMELRGLGIINILKLFGTGAVRDKKKVQQVVTIEEWNDKHQYDRLGIEDKFIEILGINIPYIIIPMRPGRNIPILVETVARNYRLKKLGYNSGKEFEKQLNHLL